MQSTASTNFAAPSQITAHGHTTSLNWNGFLGLTSATGANGENSSVVYEPGKSRPQSTTSKTGAVTTYSYGAPNPLQSVAGTMTATTGSAWVKTTYGGFGRPVKVETGTGGTTVSVSETEYAPCACTPVGKAWRTSRPKAPSDTTYWTTNEYDALGRTVKVLAPDGSPTTYTYTANRVRTTDAKGKWKEFTMNGLGQLVTVNEPNPAGGADYVTSYEYNTLGQLAKVTMPRPTGTQTRTFNYTSGKLTSATNPETGTATHEYYPAGGDPGTNTYGLLKHTIDARQQKTEYLYDTYQRVTEVKRYAAGQSTADACQGSKNYYDFNPFDGGFGTNLADRLAVKEYKVCSGSVTRTVKEMYSYTPAGLLLKKRLQVQVPHPANGSMVTRDLDAQYTWNADGQMTTMRYPNADTKFEFTINGLGQYVEMKERSDSNPNFPVTIVSNVQYGAAGELMSLTQGNTLEERRYNTLGQVKSIQAYQGSYTQTHLDYYYEAGQNNGRIVGVGNRTNGEEIAYYYDSLNRLVTQTGSMEQYVTFEYDGFGNLTKNGAQTIGVDAATNRLVGPSYDNNGNQTTRMVGSTWQTLTYDVANRLQSQSGTNEEYRYAPDNRRVWIKQGAEEHWVFWGPNGKQLGAYRVDFAEGGGPAYTTTVWTKKWFGSREVSATAPITQDRLGSKVGSGATRFGYYPYGEPRTVGGASGGSEFATYTTDSTGLMYADQRYYQSGVGRFATADPYVASGGSARPLSWNRFTYVEGDPINLHDPQGLFSSKPGEEDQERESPDPELCWVGGHASTQYACQIYRNEGRSKEDLTEYAISQRWHKSTLRQLEQARVNVANRSSFRCSDALGRLGATPEMVRRAVAGATFLNGFEAHSPMTSTRANNPAMQAVLQAQLLDTYGRRGDEISIGHFLALNPQTVAVSELGGPLGPGTSIYFNPLLADHQPEALLFHEALHLLGFTDAQVQNAFQLPEQANTGPITNTIQRTCL